MPRNTEKDPALLHLITVSKPGGIEAQESQGQQQLVNDETLPTDIRDDGEKQLEEMGVVFKESVEGDRIFQNVVLPKGWQKKATDHSMWSDLVDDKGVKVAGIFYKASFYDRSAFMYVEVKKD